MSFLAWNCRGLGNPLVEDELETIIRAQDPLIFFLVGNLVWKKTVRKVTV